jgi:hypothetical protein
MVERSVRDLAEGWPDTVVSEQHPDVAEPSRRRKLFRRRPKRAESGPAPRVRYQKSRHSRGLTLLRGVGRIWIPVAILVVVVAGGVTVSRLHGLFGSDKSPSYGDTRIDSDKPFKPKLLRYEVFGAPGTVADISYIEPNGDPKLLSKVQLPWSLDIEATQNTSMGNLMAQGDSDSIGCRIVLDGVVKAEKISNQEQAFASCLPKVG